MRKNILFIICLIIAGCSTLSSLQYPPVMWLRDSDNEKIPQPEISKEYKYSNSRFGQLSSQTENVLMFAQNIVSTPMEMNFTGKQEALNVDNFDEVADSAWFTNRLGRTGTFANNFKTPPLLSGKWKVIANNKKKDVQEFVIHDAKGDDYLIRVDNDPDWLVSGGEMLGALVLGAAGYNVTENYIVEFNSGILDKDVVSRGRYRALAVRIPKGTQLGYFAYQGKRKDDPNDRIPHEHRRELRGLRIFSAFLNNRSVNIRNNLDIYENKYVTHYLSNLSAPLANMRSEFLSGSTKTQGHTVDSLFSFGFYNPYWTAADSQVKEYKGVLSSEKFRPEKWKPNDQNMAFRFMTNRDAFWATSIIQKLSDDDIREIVGIAGYKNQKVADRVAEELIIRRDKIVAYWFKKLNPLFNFKLNGVITFDDLGGSDDTIHRFRIRDIKGDLIFQDWQETTGDSIPLPDNINELLARKRYLVVSVQTLRNERKNWWSPSVDVYLEDKDGPTILGIHRRYNH